MVNAGAILFLALSLTVAVGMGYAGIIAIDAVKDTDKVTSKMDSPSSPPSPPFSPSPAPLPPSPPPPLAPPPPAARRALETTHFALRDDERKLLAKSAARLR